jgi:hypothetical protein
VPVGVVLPRLWKEVDGAAVVLGSPRLQRPTYGEEVGVAMEEAGIPPQLGRRVQIAWIEAQSRPTIGLEVADPAQAQVQALDRIQIWQQNQAVDAARAACTFVDAADLAAEDELDRGSAGGCDVPIQGGSQVSAQAVEPGLRRNQLAP